MAAGCYREEKGCGKGAATHCQRNAKRSRYQLRMKNFKCELHQVCVRSFLAVTAHVRPGLVHDFPDLHTKHNYTQYSTAQPISSHRAPAQMSV
jgi:hypothetical protein